MTDSTQQQQRAWTRAEVDAKIRDILVESLGASETEVTPGASLVRDLGAESIDFLDIGFKIQQEFGVNLHTAEIRDRVMAWSAMVHPTIVSLVAERCGVTMTVEDVRGVEKGGLTAVLAAVNSRQPGAVPADTADGIGRELVARLVQEFATLGCAVGDKDQADLLAIMRTDVSTRKLTERTLDLLTVDALAGFVCAKLGPRLARA